jgi:alanine racemase
LPSKRGAGQQPAASNQQLLRAWIDVDLAALARNAATLTRHSGAQLLPMVKADAYGLGVGPVVRALEPLDPWGYGVATVAEGEELRDLGITRPVIVFTPLLVAELPVARKARLTPALGDSACIEAWGNSGEWQLAIDTGMLRAGLDWRHVESVYELLRKHPPAGAFTHFHSAELEDGSMAEQERRFAAALESLPARPPLVHMDNSAAIVRRGRSELPVVRPGIFLYGASAVPQARVLPEQVVHVRARIVDIRDGVPGDTVSYGATQTLTRASRIATIALGHADGYPIALSGKGGGLLHGATVPVAGRVTMDMTMLDVTGVPCECGDAVTLVGRDGNALLRLEDVAAQGGVSPYEMLVRMRNRIPRIYHNG